MRVLTHDARGRHRLPVCVGVHSGVILADVTSVCSGVILGEAKVVYRGVTLGEALSLCRRVTVGEALSGGVCSQVV